ncbi:putative Eukaryotic translation initiation factor 2 subunit 1, partial [Hypsibius exemplaris]
NPSVLDGCDLDNDTKTALLAEIRQKLTVRGTKVRAYMEVACFGYDGIDAVKEALRAGLTLSTDDCPIKINLIVPPTYVLTTTAARQADGAKLLNNAMKLIEVAIQKKDMGKFRIQLAPTAVTETDENAFTQRLGQLDRENQEVSGDDDSNSN